MRVSVTKSLRITVGLAVLGALMCSNPTDQEPVAWRTAVQVPLANGDFVLGEEMQKWFDKPDSTDTTLRVLYVDSQYNPTGRVPLMITDTTLGDTVALSIPDKDTTSFTIDEDSLEDKVFDVTLGEMTIEGQPAVNGSTPIPGTPVSNTTLPISFPGLFYARFAASSPPLSVTLNNNSPSVTLSNVEIGLEGGTATQVGTIGPNSSATAEVAVAGLEIRNPANFVVSFNPSGADAANGLSYEFSLNGLTVDSIMADDSYAQFSWSFTNDYDITDTLDVEYVDFRYGWFDYSMLNNTGLTLDARAVHHDMWSTPYSIIIGAERQEDLAEAGTLDSSMFQGNIMNTALPVRPGQELPFAHWNISGMRLFPQWDTTQARSETYVEYLVSTPPADPGLDDTVSLSSGDQLIFYIRSSFIQAKQMMGVLMEDYEREGDTEYVAVEWPFDSAQLEQLDGRFFFERVFADIGAEMDLPDSAYMDSFITHFELRNPDDLTAVCSTTARYGRVKKDTAYTNTLDIKDLLNTWPDTLRVTANAMVPKGTRVFIVSDLEVRRIEGGIDNDRLGSMTIRSNVNYRIKPYIDYRVDAPATILLGEGKPWSTDKAVAMRKLTDRYAELKMHVENYTNVHVKLRAILAPDSNGAPNGAPLDTILPHLSVDSVLSIATSPSLVDGMHPDGYINLLDTNGLYIPQRDSTFDNAIPLTDEQLAAFLKSQRVRPAWLLTFMPGPRDALSDTDVVNIRSSVYVEGITSTDSLFSEW